ncbi:MAG: glycolate oxidase subunit GlcF [Gammaproteobacteria bacterium]
MRAPVADSMAREPYSARAADIVRSCVHCGFCNATCPTYQLTGDELEGPRGRIYLIKALLEEGRAGDDSRRHLDQCLLCRNCETTCPSGVRYGDLIELVRPELEQRVPAPAAVRLKRRMLAAVVPYRRRLAPLVWLGRLARPLLPAALGRRLERATPPPAWSGTAHARRVLRLGGCAQPVLNPHIDAAAARVFDRLGLSVVDVPASACCGALHRHLGMDADARALARANIDAWWPAIESGAEAVMATSSGCGLELRHYPALLADDPAYAARAARLGELLRDPLELVDVDALSAALRPSSDRGAVAVQAPCTLQHGLRLGGRLEALLDGLGWRVLPVAESHLCCGSAGAYSVMHAATAGALRERKLAALMQAGPAVIATANIGCQLHLASAAPVPVRHWLELLAEELAP